MQNPFNSQVLTASEKSTDPTTFTRDTGLAAPSVIAGVASHPTPRVGHTARNHRALMDRVVRHTERKVYQPCPHPVEDKQAQSPRLDVEYAYVWVLPQAYPRLERCRSLQLRLEGDILGTATQHEVMDLARCDALIDNMRLQLALATERMQLNQGLLDGVKNLADLLFRTLSLDSATKDLEIPLSDSVRRTFAIAGIDLPASVVPVQAYTLIAARWAEIEYTITELSLEALTLQLGQHRLGFYRTVAQYLVSEAQDLIKHQLDDEDCLGPGDIHPVESMLKDCIAEPFLGRWPGASGTI
jgi:hypothetical protein